MTLHIRPNLSPGYSSIVGPGNPHIKLIEFGVLRLDGSMREELDTKGRECLGVVLTGRCTVEGEGFAWKSIGGRSNVFAAPPTSFYLGPGTHCGINADGPVDVALAFSPSDLKLKAVLIPPEQTKARVVGVHNWTRTVTDILPPSSPARYLLVGETIQAPGNWSSYPPHCHEKDNPPLETKLEEVYYFKLLPSRGFGMQRLYSDDGSLDEAHTVVDNDVVLIPRGYHPVAAAPGYQLYYLWMLAGDKRVMIPRDDPGHAWVKDAEAIVKAARQ